MNDLAPIVLFVYNRPQHTLRTLRALQRNKLADQSTLYIYSDGARMGAIPDVRSAIEETRRIAKSEPWCGKVIVRESGENRGLAASIVEGVTELVNEFDKVIVLEDDLVTSPGFLTYMNDALRIYKDETRVMHVSGYMFPVTSSVEDGTVFLKIMSSWGWGTWKRAWLHYSPDVNAFVNRLDTRTSIKAFNIRGHAPFYSQLLANQAGKINSWAVKWFASWYFLGGYSLFPKTTLIVNEGHDGTGVHSAPTNGFAPTVVANEIHIVKLPLAEDADFARRIDRFYRDLTIPAHTSSLRKLYIRIRRELNSLLK